MVFVVAVKKLVKAILQVRKHIDARSQEDIIPRMTLLVKSCNRFFEGNSGWTVLTTWNDKIGSLLWKFSLPAIVGMVVALCIT